MDMTAVAAEIPDDTVARANVRRLAAAQALTGANAAVVFATGSIVGAQLAPSISLATLPLSIYMLGLAAGTLPTGMISLNFGFNDSVSAEGFYRPNTFWKETVLPSCGSYFLPRDITGSSGPNLNAANSCTHLRIAGPAVTTTRW